MKHQQLTTKLVNIHLLTRAQVHRENRRGNRKTNAILFTIFTQNEDKRIKKKKKISQHRKLQRLTTYIEIDDLC